MVCTALMCFLSTECATSIYVLEFNYHAQGCNYHIYSQIFTFMHGFGRIEYSFLLQNAKSGVSLNATRRSAGYWLAFHSELGGLTCQCNTSLEHIAM